MTYRPLLASYGGGHAQIIAAVAKAMRARGIAPDVLGFTTAYRSFLRAGLEAKSVETLIDAEANAPYLEAVHPFLGGERHPDVSQAETQAYFAIGLQDLVARFGWSKALTLVQSEGRKAFEPVSAMMRYLDRVQPDIVVTTTSPRFELALLKAARKLGIPTLAIGDLFLVQEIEWMRQPGYAEDIAVLSSSVADLLVSAGISRSALRVTGNPAFDSLAPGNADADRRNALRSEWGVAEKRVIMWPAAGAATAMDGSAFHTPDQVVEVFEALCKAVPSFAYILRPHPNHPFELGTTIGHGYLDNGKLTPEEALLICDVVCVEASTMGLQAALRGIPVVCVGYSDYALYPKFGLAQAVDTLDEAVMVLKEGRYSAPGPFAMPPLGTASDNVLEFIDDILARPKKAQAQKINGE